MSKKHKKRTHRHPVLTPVMVGQPTPGFSDASRGPSSPPQLSQYSGMHSSLWDINRELKRITLTFACLVVLLGIIWYDNTRTSQIHDLENYLTRILHVN